MLLKNFLFDESAIGEWKQQGKKILGYFSSSVPEELIHAADILPVRIFGKAQRIEMAHKYIPSWCCSYSRRCLEDALNGEYGWLDGIVGAKFDDTHLQLFDLWRYVTKPHFSYLVQTPIVRTKSSKEILRTNLMEFGRKLETFSGKEVSETDLADSIKVYNQNRRLLKKLYECRKRRDIALDSVEVLKAVIASMTMPKDKHNEKLLDCLGKISSISKSANGKPRVHICGMEIYDPLIFQAIEDCGASIVSDDLDTGSRYFWTEVDENNDPYEAIAERYLFDRVTDIQTLGQFSKSISERAEHIEHLVDQFHAEGVIFLVDIGCETLGHAYAHLRSMLKESGIPSTRLNLDFPFPREQCEMRLKVFLETLTNGDT